MFYVKKWFIQIKQLFYLNQISYKMFFRIPLF